MREVVHTPWPEVTPPSEARLEQILSDEGLDFYSWSNGPYEVYAAHLHGYDKVIYCVSGSITFHLVQAGTWYKLAPGDRLDLPAGVIHAAEVGPEGVVCLEAHL